MSSGLKIKVSRRSLYEDQVITNMKDKEFLVAQIKRDQAKIKKLGDFDFSALALDNFDDFKPVIQQLSRTKYFHHFFKVYHKQKPMELRIYGSGVEFNGKDYSFDDLVFDNISDTKISVCTKEDLFDLVGPGEKIKKIYTNYIKLLTKGEYRVVVLSDFTDPHNKVVQKYTAGNVVKMSPDNLWAFLKSNTTELDWVPIQILQPVFSNAKAIEIFSVKYWIKKSLKEDADEPGALKSKNSDNNQSQMLSGININDNGRPRSTAGASNPMKGDASIAKELEQFYFIDYALKYFIKMDAITNSGGTVGGTLKRKKQADWSSLTTVDLVKFAKQVIKTPITQKLFAMGQQSHNEAVDIFTLIMTYMGDLINDKISKEEAALTIVANARKYPELLEEVYAQLIKQTTNNKGQGDSEKRGWILIKLMCIFTRAPKDIEPYFKRHILATAMNATKSANTIAEECLKYLKSKETFKERTQLPSFEEFFAIEQNKLIQLPVFIGSQPQLYEVDTYTTVGELMDIIADVIQMTDELYNLTTVCGMLPEGEILFPDDHMYILDVFSSLKSIVSKTKVKDAQRLALTKLAWKVPPTMPTCYAEFSQAAANVVLGKWLTATDLTNNKDKIVDIYAILCKYRDSTEKDIPSLFTDNLNKELMGLKGEIWKKVGYYQSFTKERLHDAYVTASSSLKLYGGFSYFMSVPDYPKTKKDAMVTVNARGLYVHETSKFEEILFIPYSKLLNVRVGENDCMITHGDLIKKTTTKLVTTNGYVINTL